MNKDLHYQFPLRMPRKLADELEKAVSSTGMTRSKLCRMGISRILQDLDSTGRTNSMGQFLNHYREIV